MKKKPYRFILIKMSKNIIIKMFFLILFFCSVISGQSQNKSTKILTGTVSEENGNLLPGVTIVVKGTTIGTTSDNNGNFTISAPEKAQILVFSFIGLETKEVPIENKTKFSVTLTEKRIGLSEVVIVGYGTQKKETVVGAVSNVTSAELEKTGGVTNLAQALTGQLAGLTTVLSTGEPGNDDPTIMIRGKSTWNDANPLVLVDGVERKMNDIDVNEVEAVSILKDASATAVFGVKGAEGVILITTKRGKMGKPQFSVESNVGVKLLSRTPEKLDSYEAFKYRNYAIENELAASDAGWGSYVPTAILNRYKKPQAPGDQYLFPNVDWPKEMLNDFATSKQVNMNVSGGTNFAKYFGSLSYINEGDLLKSGIDNGQGYKTKWGYNRINYRTNIDFNLTNTTLFTANISGYVGTKFENYTTEEGTSNSVIGFYGISPSTFPVRYADGTWGYNVSQGNQINPVNMLNTTGLEKIVRTQVSTDFKLNQKLDFITKGMEVQASLSYDNLFYSSGGVFEVYGSAVSKNISPNIIDVLPGGVYDEDAIAALPAEIRNKYVTYNPNQGTNNFDFYARPPSYLAEGLRTADNWNANNYLSKVERRLFYQFSVNYARRFNKHDFTALALMNREQYAQGSMFPRYREDWVGRITYNYDGRYLFESNGAYNGSEKFADKYRFGFFPSVAIGWVLSNEAFLKRDWLDNFKIRYSVGKVGNDNFNSPRWAYETTWRIDGAKTPFGYPSYGYSPYTQTVESVIGNPDLHWETSIKQNLGIELAVLNKFTMNAEFFKDNRKDIFMSATQRNIPVYFGALPVAANLGETKTKGFEFEFKFKNTTRSGLYYWLNWAFTRAVDEVVFMEDPELLPDYQKKEGFQIDQTRSLISQGFVTNWDDVYASTNYASNNSYKLPGDFNMIDFNADGKIDDYDKVPYGYPLRPQNTYNLSFGINYKGFGANVQFYGVYNVTREVDLLPFLDTPAELVYALQGDDYFTVDNTDASFKAGRYSTRNQSLNGSFYMIDGSYLRLKTAEISYTSKSPWLKNSTGISSAKVFLNGNNLLFWSDMPDDRESNTSRVLYPTYRRINLGVNLIF